MAFGKLCIPFLKIILVLGFIICFFAFARLYQDLDILSLVLVTGVASIIPVLVIPMSIVMSSLYDMSSKFKRHLSIRIQFEANQERRRVLEGQLKSCALIRCQVGNFYHMEAKAKLTLIHNVLNGIVFLMVNAK